MKIINSDDIHFVSLRKRNNSESKGILGLSSATIKAPGRK
jgi:hypothetical protein